MPNEPKMVPVQYIPMQPEEDEIDLKELIKTILKHKIFIIVFTAIITILAALYAFSKTPIYEIKASIQLGYIYSNSNSNSNSNSKIYLLDPYATKVYLENVYKKDKYDKIKYPTINISTPKNINDIYNLNIDAFSNKEAIEYLNKIINDLKNKESKKLNSIKTEIDKQIKILKNANKRLKIELKTLNEQLKSTKDAQIYTTILNNISKIQSQITKNELTITNLETTLSPANTTPTHIIGTIKKSPNPIKPKKKLIITVAFITGFILSIFLVFFIEFIKSFKEEKE